MTDHPRMRLNNLIQATHGTHVLRYEQRAVGEPHAPEWTVVAYINDREYGTGTARTVTDAREEAARNTLNIIAANGNRLY